MAWSVLQSNSNTQTAPATTFAATYSSNAASGTVLIAVVAVSGAKTISSVKDGAANSFTLVGTVNLNNSPSQGVCAIYALATPAGDVGIKPTITATVSGSTVGSIWIGEVSGIQAVTDGTPGTAFGAAGACTPTYSDTASGEFFLTAFGDNGGPETSSVTGGWTVDSKSINTNADANTVVAYGNSTGGTETNAWTSTGSTTQCGAVAVAFKLASGGGPTVAQPVVVTARVQPLAVQAAAPFLVPLAASSATSVPLTDSGAGSDAVTVAPALTDTGAGSDSLTVLPWLPQPLTAEPTVPLASRAAPPLLVVLQAIQTPLTDSGSGSDALSVVAPLADSGSGTDMAAVAVVLLDSGSGSDTAATLLISFLPALLKAPALPPPGTAGPAPFLMPLAAIPPGIISLPDSGSGSDTLSDTAADSLTDTGSGADTLSVSVIGQVSALVLTPARQLGAMPSILPQLISPMAGAVIPASLSDTAAGADTLVVSVQLTDAGSSTETVAVMVSVTDSGTGSDVTATAVLLTESAAGTDAVAVTVRVVDTGAGADVLTVGTASISLSDAGSGADTLVVALTVFVADFGAGTDTLTLPPPGNTGTVRWRAAPALPRWHAAPQQPRWTAMAAGPRWRAVLMDRFAPIAAISLQEVNVLWTSDLAGTIIDPTVAPLVVQMAFPISSGMPGSPAQPATWYTAGWLTGSTIKGWIAQCLVGPGGTLTLVSGQSYDVWSKIQGSPEIPALFAGVQQVY